MIITCVNAVAPGITRTDMVAALPEAVIKPADLQRFLLEELENRKTLQMHSFFLQVIWQAM